MTTFGIIAEGITDQVVIENILIGYFAKDGEEPVVNYVQPPRDVTGRSGTGGWTLVFEHLQRGEHLESLQFNDYLVIHIDTDVCEDKGFDVPRQENGNELSPRDLASKVVEKLQSFIGPGVCAHYGDRLLFAVAVHGIECWLMPLFFSNNKSEKIAGCLDAANHELDKKNERRLSKADGSSKDPRAYGQASRPYQKRAKLLELRDKNPSLGAFVDQLERIGKTPEP